MKIKTEIRNIKKRNPNADTVSKSRSISFDAKPAVDYVLSEKDHKGEKREHPPVIIQGDADLTRQLDKAFKTDVKTKSRSGIIGFKNNEERDKVDANEFVDRWKELVLGDLSPRLNCLFVEHREEPKPDAVDGGDHTHFHFVINLIDTYTKNALNPFDARPYDKSGGPMWIPAIEATERVVAYEFGLDQVVPKEHATNDMQRKLEKGYINEKSKNYEEVKMNVSSMIDMNKLADALKKQHQPKDINELKELMLKEKNIHKITIKDKETWINYTNANGKTTNMKLTGSMWKKGTTFAVRQGNVQVAERKPYDQASYLKDLALINRYQKARVDYLNSRLSAKDKATPFVFTKVEPYKSIVLRKEQNNQLLDRVRKTFSKAVDGVSKSIKKSSGGFSAGGGGSDKQSIINQIAQLKGRLMDHSLDQHTMESIAKQIVELELQLRQAMMDEASRNQQAITDSIARSNRPPVNRRPTPNAVPVKQATAVQKVATQPTPADKDKTQPDGSKQAVVLNPKDSRSVDTKANVLSRADIDKEAMVNRGEVKVRLSSPNDAAPANRALPVFTKVQSDADKQAIAEMKATSTMTDEKRKEMIKAYAMKKMMEKRNQQNSSPVDNQPDSSVPTLSKEEQDDFNKIKDVLPSLKV